MPDLLLGGIAINEVLVDPNGSTYNFDTDGNGSAAAIDEFVELVNLSGAAIDISGVELWDSGSGNYFTFPPGTVLQPGGHAMVITGLGAGGSLPTGGPYDLFFDAGRGSAVINNGGDNIVVYDPTNDEYVSATFNGDTLDDPTLGAGGYSGFSSSATQQGNGEDFGNDTDGQSLQRDPNNTSTFVDATPTPGTTNVCFAGGTLFDTPQGPRSVAALRPGDLVHTLDHGPRPITWVFAKTWAPKTLQVNQSLCAVVIARGTLGDGIPRRDLRVSQHHRMLVRGPIAERMFGCVEVLIAARHLIDLPGISLDLTPSKPLSYFHVMLDQHEVLFAEGAPAESLYLGTQALKSMPAEALQEVAVLTGTTIEQIHASALENPARPLADGHRARALVRRHANNAKPLLAAIDPIRTDQPSLRAYSRR